MPDGLSEVSSIDQSDQLASAIQVEPVEALEAWNLLRSHLAQIKRYSVLTYDWGERP